MAWDPVYWLNSLEPRPVCTTNVDGLLYLPASIDSTGEGLARGSKFLTRNRARTSVRDYSRRITDMDPIYLDYPVNPRPRYGYGCPPHTQLNNIIGLHRAKYAAW